MWSRAEETLPGDIRIDLDRIADRVVTHQPRAESLRDGRRASVAVVLRSRGEDSTAGPEVLIIERASHDADPWSGQMAFPGGKIDPDDNSARHAAEREASEELALRLGRDEYLGQLDDVLGINAGIKPGVVLSSFVYLLEREPEFLPNEEVAEALWVPLDTFFHPEFALSMQHPREPGLRVSGVRVGSRQNQVMWGLSLRVINLLFSLAGLPYRDWRVQSG